MNDADETGVRPGAPSAQTPEQEQSQKIIQIMVDFVMRRPGAVFFLISEGPAGFETYRSVPSYSWALGATELAHKALLDEVQRRTEAARGTILEREVEDEQQRMNAVANEHKGKKN